MRPDTATFNPFHGLFDSLRPSSVNDMAKRQLETAQRELFNAELSLVSQQHEVNKLRGLISHLQRQVAGG